MSALESHTSPKTHLNPSALLVLFSGVVYRARRPFAPLRLWETIRNRLVVIQDSYEDMLEGMEISHESDLEGSDPEDDAMDEDEEDEEEEEA